MINTRARARWDLRFFFSFQYRRAEFVLPIRRENESLPPTRNLPRIIYAFYTSLYAVVGRKNLALAAFGQERDDRGPMHFLHSHARFRRNRPPNVSSVAGIVRVSFHALKTRPIDRTVYTDRQRSITRSGAAGPARAKTRD